MRIRHSALLAMCLVLAGATSAPAAAYTKSSRLDGYSGQRALDRADPAAGPMAPYEPNQVRLEEDFAIAWEGYEITGSFAFALEAVVLSRKDYQEGDMGALVPIDIAFAWGRITAPSTLRHLQVKQSDRLYMWKFPAGTDLSVEEVSRSSANMHIMPANDAVLQKFSSVRKGDLVRLSGFLVNISKPGSFEWRSSLTRDDVGKGACEIILVESVEVVR